MPLHYDTHAVKKHINLTANSALVELVKKEKGNLSALFEHSMIEFLSEREMERWKADNQAAFESYNRMIETHSLLSDDLGLL